MRELDVLLTRYFEQQYKMSGNAEKAAFRRLLDLPDPELNGYLLGGLTPRDEEVADVVQRIRGQT